MSSPDRQPDERPEASPQTTPSAATVLDSVFRKDGPMPPASVKLRAFAFLLDVILVGSVASVIIWKIVLPSSNPSASTELDDWSKSYASWYLEYTNNEITQRDTLAKSAYFLSAYVTYRIPPIGPQPERNLREALAIGRELQMLTFWLYFAIGEAFFAGSSLGKRICRIRSVSTVTLAPPPIMAGIVRGGLKTLTLHLFFPFGMIATLAALFFNKRRQMGHDLMSRTAVIDEKFVNLQRGD